MRGIGLSNGQFELTYKDIKYDVAIDTFYKSSLDSANEILKFINVGTM